MIPRHQRMMRNGWSIPNSLEWIFWPFGFSPANVPPSYQPIARRFKLTNREKFIAQLVRLGAIKEQKQ